MRKVDVTLTFTSPLLMNNLDLMARPVSYISYKVKSNDQKTHDVDVYLQVSSALAVNIAAQEVVGESSTSGKLSLVRIGSKQQQILGKKGDDLRIDWGYVYVAAPTAASLSQQIVSLEEATPVVTTGKANSVSEGKTTCTFK